MTTKYERRSTEQRIAELEAKINGIKEREERAKVRKDPVAQQTKIALKALDKALALATEETVRGALMQARHDVAATIEIMGGVAKAPVAEPQPEPRRARRASTKTEA